MATYSQLIADVNDWLDDELTSQAPTFIALAEDIHRYGLEFTIGPTQHSAPAIRIPSQEVLVELVATDTYLTLPADYLDMRRLRMRESSRWRRLNYVSPENLGDSSPGQTPQDYTVHTGRVEFDSSGADASTFELLYYAKFPRLSATVPTNALLDDAYGCYLYASMLQADIYTRDQEAQLSHLQAYVQAATAVQKAETSRSSSRARKQVRNLRVSGTTGLY